MAHGAPRTISTRAPWRARRTDRTAARSPLLNERAGFDPVFEAEVDMSQADRDGEKKPAPPPGSAGAPEPKPSDADAELQKRAKAKAAGDKNEDG